MRKRDLLRHTCKVVSEGERGHKSLTLKSKINSTGLVTPHGSHLSLPEPTLNHELIIKHIAQDHEPLEFDSPYNMHDAHGEQGFASSPRPLKQKISVFSI